MLTPTHQDDLFSLDGVHQAVTLDGDGLEAFYQPRFVASNVANMWFEELLQTTHWQQDTVTVYGKRHLTPRLSCWMGESWMSYSYSGQTMRPQPWQALPLEIKLKIEAATGETFNSVLINYYRDGRDSNGWHSDDEQELGAKPVIASLSLGAARDFHLRSKSNHALQHRLKLASGSLLMMSGSTQDFWQHQVPKRAHADARLNLTFRKIVRT